MAIERYVIRDGKEIVRQTLASAGPVSCCTSPSNGFVYTGDVEFDVQPGDKYGFRMSGSHNDRSQILQGTLTLSVPDVTAPVITPTVTGTKGANGFYTSDVKVSWKTVDPDSGVTRDSGCGDVTIRRRHRRPDPHLHRALRWRQGQGERDNQARRHGSAARRA